MRKDDGTVRESVGNFLEQVIGIPGGELVTTAGQDFGHELVHSERLERGVIE